MTDYDQGYLDGLHENRPPTGSDEYEEGWRDGEYSRLSNTCSHRSVASVGRYRVRIPPLGEEIVLDAPWTFTLYEERRNWDFSKNLGLKWERYPWRREAETHKVTLPKGTVLQVDRIFIRKGAKEFDSLSFHCNPRVRGLLNGRFWAKLDEVNQIVARRAPDPSEN